MDIAPTTMVRSEMEHVVDTLYRTLGVVVLQQISFLEFNGTLVYPTLDILFLSAGQVIHHAYPGAFFYQFAH